MGTSASKVTPLRTGTMESLPADCGVRASAQRALQSVWDGMAIELARTVRALGIRPERADDVLQEVYLTAWRESPAGLSEVELRRWLWRVTINQCHLEHRRRSRWRNVWRRLASVWGDADRHAEGPAATCRNEEQGLIREALGRLEPDVRSLLVLRYFAELDSGEIGQILQMPDATVRSRLRAARRRLAVELQRAGYCHDE